MGNYKFKLSDMIPNAWFYKLRDMSKPRKQSNTGSTTMFNSHPKKKTQPSPPTFSAATSSPSKPKQVKQVTPHHQGKNHHHHCHQSRKSYYFTRELNSTGENRSLCNSPVNPKVSDNNTLPHDPPRKSSRQKIKNRRTANRSTSSEQQLWSSSHSSFDSSDLEFHRRESLDEPEFRCDRVLAPDTFDGMISFSNSNDKDIVIDIDKASLLRKKNVDSFSELDLPPIITKPGNFSKMVCEVKKKNKKKKKKEKEIKEQPVKSRKSSLKFQEDNSTSKEHVTSTVRRVTSSTSPGVRLRNVNSPRIANKKINQAQIARRSLSSNSSSKRSLSESFAIVKSSFDPQRDFRDSMVEMIIENNIKSSKDLEDLLACYLSLNADEYHELIIQVFKQIWFDLTDVQSK